MVERVPLREPVLVEIEDSESRLGHTRDLTVRGAFVEGVSAPLGAHVVIHLRFRGPDWTIALAGVVRWAERAGIAVEFGKLGARETEAVVEAIARAVPSRTRERAAAPVEVDDDDDDGDDAG